MHPQDLDNLLEELLAWLEGLENTLNALEAEPLPDDKPTLEMLIADHREFMENTSRRQNEVDRVCKARQIKPVKDTKKISKAKSPAPTYVHILLCFLLSTLPSPHLSFSKNSRESRRIAKDRARRESHRTFEVDEVVNELILACICFSKLGSRSNDTVHSLFAVCFRLRELFGRLRGHTFARACLILYFNFFFF